jgi:plasmid stability protein
MPKVSLIAVQVRLPDESRRLLRVRAAEQGRTQSAIVHDLIMSALSIDVPVKRKRSTVRA